jgi:hypothetical protein
LRSSSNHQPRRIELILHLRAQDLFRLRFATILMVIRLFCALILINCPPERFW